MRISIALLSAAVAVSAAQPHHHGHQHLHKEKRTPKPAADYVTVPGPVEIVYVLNGTPIPESEVQQGIKNGTLVFASDGQLSSAAPPSYKAPATTASPSSTSTSVWVAPTTTSVAQPTTSSSVYVAPTSASTTSSSASAPVYTSASASTSAASYSGSSGSGWSSSATGVDADFPDGELDCSTFPSDYGAVAVDYMGLGGWIGIQCPGSSSTGGFSNIETKTSGSTCTEGDFCSYACPAGYQKSQWPTTQGSTGQSVGGVKCTNGKLRLTNSALSSKLCMAGTDKVNVVIQNNLSKSVAVCRTDYPGTESETVPVDAAPGASQNLTCPDADNYYTWEGSSTSAQYYVNPAGVPVQDACQWGGPENPWGNYAPMNLGVGYSNGAAWLSIFQNSPTTDAKLDFCVEIQGDNISGYCKYSNGQYCSGENYDDCSSTTGCTVSLSSGTATFVFSD